MKVFRRFLNVLTVSADLTSDGKLFQARGAAMQKTRSPRRRRLLVLLMNRIVIVGRAQGDLAVESVDGL